MPKIIVKQDSSVTEKAENSKPRLEEQLKKSSVPISGSKSTSKFSIQNALNPAQSENETEKEAAAEALPTSHFSDTDLEKAWTDFLEKLRIRDIVIFSAINGFRLNKKDECTVLVSYPSETAKAEFEKVQSDFFNHFRHLTNNFSVKPEFKLNTSIKKEVMTKRKLFEKMAEINPLLLDLDNLVKFDFT